MCSQGGVADKVKFGICMSGCCTDGAVGLVVMMGRCQRVDPSSIFGRRMCYEIYFTKAYLYAASGLYLTKVKLSINILVGIFRFFLCTCNISRLAFC
jgi:hypothetical protein